MPATNREKLAQEMTLTQLLQLTKELNYKHFAKVQKQGRVENLLISTVGLSGEVGEFANLIKKYAREKYGGIRKKKDKNRDYLAEARDELVDVFLMVLVLAVKLDIDLEKDFLQKLKDIPKDLEKI